MFLKLCMGETSISHTSLLLYHDILYAYLGQVAKKFLKYVQCLSYGI